MKLPVIAIVGRVNTGKSTLFNRLVGKPLAVTGSSPGITRDPIKKPGEWDGAGFFLVDTGGFLGDEGDELWPRVKGRIAAAIQDADLVIFLTNARDGLLPQDRDMARWLRKQAKPVLVAVNKCDSPKVSHTDFFELGFPEVFPVSAITGQGVAELMERALELAGRGTPLPAKTDLIRISILGKPNVGKSSLLNALAGKTEAITSPIPGTTRDAVEAVVQGLLVVDTPGIKRHFQDELEYYSHLRSLRSLRYAEVCLVVTDATAGIKRIDKKIARLVRDEGRGAVVCINKVDTVAKRHRQELLDEVKRSLGFMRPGPFLLVSALTGYGVDEIPRAVRVVHREFHKQVGRTDLYQLLVDSVAKLSPGVMLLEMKQVHSAPPVFRLTATGKLKPEYLRFLEKEIRARFGFFGVPLRIETRVVGKGR